jgi:hypothetical protein
MPTEPDAPLIASLDDLMTTDEAAKFFNVSKKTVDMWRYGREQAAPKLPYFRLANKIYLSRAQLVWWLNEWQKRVIDKYHVDRMRRLEKGIKVGREFRRDV